MQSFPLNTAINSWQMQEAAIWRCWRVKRSRSIQEEDQNLMYQVAVCLSFFALWHLPSWTQFTKNLEISTGVQTKKPRRALVLGLNTQERKFLRHTDSRGFALFDFLFHSFILSHASAWAQQHTGSNTLREKFCLFRRSGLQQREAKLHCFLCSLSYQCMALDIGRVHKCTSKQEN